MARHALRLSENVSGNYFVDETCIDCGLCRQIAPATFGRSPRGLSYVHTQPEGVEAELRALMALVTCPTASIGTLRPVDARAAAAQFPERVADSVFFCGFASESSYGAASYLVRRPQGNVLVDSPRAAEPLLKRIDQLGGVSVLFLTHRDDVADHERLRRRFGCERILNAADVSAETRSVERLLEGREPIRIADDLVAIPVPGHTRGSTALLYRDAFLFSGDHLWWEEERQALHASSGVCWYSWPEQVGSLERLLDFEFEWVLPGHGGRYHADHATMKRELRDLVTRVSSPVSRR
jgi:glyoxylase-like metal-dependent hydrolase (beta-lactamase superfamily II)/ferredoxin